MNKDQLQAHGLLLLTAMIWGSAFVAQRIGMEYVEPFTFNGVRFLLGSLSLLPLLIRSHQKESLIPTSLTPQNLRTLFLGGGLLGLALFMGVSLQQVGMVYTTAGKAGFITGLYVVLVPLVGLFWGQRLNLLVWLGVGCAIIGLYLLSVTENFTIAFGDLLVLISAFFWAGHVHLVSWFSTRINPLLLSFMQFMVCALLSLGVALLTESPTLHALMQATWPICYGAFLSVGVAYTLQVVAQRNAHPVHAALILSLEAVFAAVGGWLVLGETLPLRGFLGCTLMLVGVFLSQLPKPQASLKAEFS